MTDVMTLIQEEAEHLREFCAALAPEAWGTPSACAGWAVGDVLAHLAQGAQNWSASLGRALAGDAQPPAGEQPLRPGERGSEVTAQRAMTLRQEKSAAGLLQAFAEGHARFDVVLRTIQATDWERPCYHRRGNMTVRNYVILRLQELTVHGWDIRSAFDSAATLSEPPLQWLLPSVQRWLTSSFRPVPELTAPRRYRFDTSGAFTVQQDVVVSQDGMRLEAMTTQPADVTFRGTTGNALLLIYGRLTLERAVEAGRLAILGERSQAALFSTLFQGF
jgi:maleylpyruvate isomerase